MHRVTLALLVALAIVACGGCRADEAPAAATAVPGLPTFARPPLTTPSVSLLPSLLPSPSPGGATSGGSTGPGQTYTVQPGDNLSSISARFYGDASETAWRQIFEANRDTLPAPERLSTGMVLRIPPARPTSTTAAAPTPTR
jgi:nucleoid-associated protein YgaU